jgi:signal transduction histidine kinase
VREVTREREAQAFERHVVGVVGHDLRNPLSAIVTATKLLRRADPPSDPARLLGRISASAARVEEIIRALLDFANVRGGRGVPLRRRPHDLAEIAREVAEECTLAHPGRQVLCAGEGDCTGNWDAGRIAQLLTNLVSNALQHGPEDVPVHVRWEGLGREVVLEVANAGRPIPPEIVPRLFEPFQRGDDARRGGLGLGLFISRAIVAAHGGSIEVRSGEPGGTVFSVRLPRA